MSTATATLPAAADPTDLLRDAAAGDRRAWAELVRRYTPLLRARTRGYRLQEADALDVAQVTWMRLAENLHKLHTPEHLAGWLATVVTRECQRVRRDRGRLVLAEDWTETSPAPDPGPEQHAVDADTAATVRAALATLPPRRRALLEALFADDPRPYTDIARDLGMAIGSVGPTRARGLADLRRTLEGLGLTA